MLKNYIKIALRNIYRNKVFSFINIVGLAIGLAVSFCIMIFVMHELSYDKHHENYDKIYRVDNFTKLHEINDRDTPQKVVDKILKPISSIQKIARTREIEGFVARQGTNQFKVKNQCVNKDFFEIFSLNVLHGDITKTISNPTSIALSNNLSTKLFGRVNSIGEILEVSSISFEDPSKIVTVKVGAIYEDNLELNSVGAEVYLPYEIYENYHRTYDDEWYHGCETFVTFNENANPDLIIADVNKQFQSYVTGDEELEGVSYSFVPLSETYFINGSIKNNYSLPVVNLDKIYLYSIISIIILLMACANFVILSTSKFAVRNKEIGVRKVIGANKKNLMFQLLLESILTALLAYPLAIIIVEILMPFIGEIVNKEIPTEFYYVFKYIYWGIGITMLVGVFAGLYNVVHFSKLNPTNILKSTFTNPTRKFDLRKVLVTVQMSIFIGMIISTIVLNLQMKYVSEKDLGFNGDNIVDVFTLPLNGKQGAFLNSIKTYTGIIEASPSSTNIFPSCSSIKMNVALTSDPTVKYDFQRSMVTADYLKLIKTKMVAGSLGEELNIRGKLVLNESAIKKLGLKNPIGESVTIMGRNQCKIVGVIEDFHSHSLHSQIEPLAFMVIENYNNPFYISVRIKEGEILPTMEFLKTQWATFSESEMTYTFFNKRVAELYSDDTRLLKAVNFFTTIAILIAMMGLFGLVMFSTQQKTKEIGIRKVLGASLLNIIKMISKEYIILGFVGIIISAPIAFYFMLKWLHNFAYKIDIGIDIVFYAGVIALLLTIITISIQTIKAAIANPVDSLRDE